MRSIHDTTGRWALALALMAFPLAAPAQMPGLPVLQNAFGNPGLSAAVNFGGGSGLTVYGAAASFGAGRVQLGGGIGGLTPDSGGTSAAYGARAAVPLLSFMGGSVGIAAFGGVGGSSRSGVSTVQIPVGAAIGWRRAIGATRGISVYAAPMYAFQRASAEGESVSAGQFRASIGLDAAITRRLGVTLGGEGGAKAEPGDPGPTGSVAAVGISWAFGR